MKQYQQYIQIVEEYINRINSSGEKVIIVGAGRAGWYILKVLEHYGVVIEGFSENNECKYGQYEGYNVTSPSDYIDEFSNASMFIGAFKPNTSDILNKQLKALGFKNVNYAMDAFLFMYFHVVVKRNCDKEILAKSIAILFENYKEKPDHYGYTKSGYFVSPFVVSNITQKCSLHCKDCGQLIPYYKSPVDFSVETVVSDIKNYAQAFDVVPEISIHGGEPLMNKQVAKICEEVSSISNIVFVSFLTNGTILPSTETITALSKSGAVLQQSDYKELSPKQNEIFDLCRDNNIYSDIVYTIASQMWTRSSPTKKHNRTPDINDEIYTKCVNSNICCQLMDGELYRCPHSMHSTRLSIISKIEGDFIQLNRNANEKKQLINDIRGFFTRNNALGACDHCDPSGGIEVLPAIQLEKNWDKK